MARRRKNIVAVATTPPAFGSTITTGTIPPIQQYDAATGTFEPDYTKIPLELNIAVSLLDGDAPLSMIDGSACLTNQQWFEIGADGSLSQIIFDGGNPTEGYDGTQVLNPGPLFVWKNARPNEPINLLFQGTVIYGADRFDISDKISVRCMDTTPSVDCKFDIPQVMSYNPIHDSADLPIRLIVLENSAVADRTHFEPVWEVEREDHTWSEYGEEATDYWLDIAADGCSAVLHQDLMADGVNIRVRLDYDKNGSPSGELAEDDLSVPYCRMDIVRTLGEYKYWEEHPESMRGYNVVRLKMNFKDAKGDIVNPEDFFAVKWYAGPSNRVLGASDYVGEGMAVSVPTSIANGTDLAFETEVSEREPLKALADSDGAVLTDSDGAVLLVQ